MKTSILILAGIGAFAFSTATATATPPCAHKAAASATNKAQRINNQRVVTLATDRGETVALGGLVRDDVVNTEDKVPALNRVPVLGFLFKNKGAKADKPETIIQVTPRIVDPE